MPTTAKLRKRVAAHSMTPSGHRVALGAGVDSIEHGDVLDAETVRIMAALKIPYCPTITVADFVKGPRSKTNPIWSELWEASQASFKRLKTYVYRLIDPRNGETFYVGKGKGNRVFSHIKATPDLEGDALTNKLKRIREIELAGFGVAHVIHRHGMDDKTAFEVEAALIDAYPGLTNVAAGAGSDDYGVMHAREIVARYHANPARFQHRALLISVNRSASEASLYEATRYAWKISRNKHRAPRSFSPRVRA